MSRSRIERTVHRMAHELAEVIKDQPLLLIGMNQRGLALAGALYDSFIRFELGKASCMGLDTMEMSQSATSAGETDQQPSYRIAQHRGVVVLCDDVIFSGKTLFNVLKGLPDSSGINAIHIATLIDRGHRAFPVSPSVCGLTLQTKQGEHITVEVTKGRNLDGLQIPSLEAVILVLNEE